MYNFKLKRGEIIKSYVTTQKKNKNKNKNKKNKNKDDKKQTRTKTLLRLSFILKSCVTI